MPISITPIIITLTICIKHFFHKVPILCPRAFLFFFFSLFSILLFQQLKHKYSDYRQTLQFRYSVTTLQSLTVHGIIHWNYTYNGSNHQFVEEKRRNTDASSAYRSETSFGCVRRRRVECFRCLESRVSCSTDSPAVQSHLFKDP